jgi:hypothetical protein
MLDSGAGGGDEAGGGRNIMAYGITLLTALIALMPSPLWKRSILPRHDSKARRQHECERFINP